MDDFDQRLTGRQALADLLTHRTFANPFEETLDDGQRDIRFEQRQTDLPQRVLYVALGQPPFARQAAGRVTETAAQRIEHGLQPVRNGSRVYHKPAAPPPPR